MSQQPQQQEKKPAAKPKDDVPVVTGDTDASPSVTIQGEGIPTPNGTEKYYSAYSLEDK